MKYLLVPIFYFIYFVSRSIAAIAVFIMSLAWNFSFEKALDSFHLWYDTDNKDAFEMVLHAVLSLIFSFPIVVALLVILAKLLS